MAYVTIGALRVPVYNVKFAPTRKPPMREEPPISDTEQQIRAFAAAHDLDIDTVRRIVTETCLSVPTAQTLAELAASLNRGMVLHSTAAKGIPRAKLRQLTSENGTRKPRDFGPSKKRTAREREAVASKLREHRRKLA